MLSTAVRSARRSPPSSAERTAPADRLRLPVAAFRGVLLLLCACLAVIAHDVDVRALGLVAVLLCAAGVATWLTPHGRAAVGSALLEALMTGAFVSGSGGSRSPLLPYLLAPGLALGLYGGWRAPLAGTVATAVGLLGVRVAVHPGDQFDDFSVAGAQWVLLAAAIGMLAAGAQHLSAIDAAPQDRYAEARALLQQLREVSAGLPTGLDAPSAASALLDACQEHVPANRSAVLVRTVGEQLVPIAVRGTRRVPWRAPLTSPGPLQQAWLDAKPVVDVRRSDKAGRRSGSTLAVLPLLSGDAPFGLVVLEVTSPDQYVTVDLRALQEAVTGRALQIESGLLFEELRASVTLEERDRLARQMHDGMAQDIAYLGYQLDALRPRATALDPALGAELGEVRGRLTALISDIRLSITDLRTTVDTERGLGGALSSYVRAIGAGKDVTVHLSLQESTFRLPGETEVLLFQVAQAVAQDMRRTRAAGHLWVTLATDPPSATLQVEHDGPMHSLAELGLQEQAESVSKMGGRLTVTVGRRGGPQVLVELGGEDGAGDRAAGR